MPAGTAKRRRAWFCAAFLAPAVAIYAVFLVAPLLAQLYLAMFNWRGVSAHRTYVGIGNFTKLAGDHDYLRAIGNNGWLLVFAGGATLGLALLIAHGMHARSLATRGVSWVYLFPQVVSIVVVGILWTFLYNPEFGLLNHGLSVVGLSGFAKPWLGDPQWALPAVAVAFVWYALGFYVMLFAAGMQQLPAEVLEAAEIDGSVGLHRFARITWPLLWSIRRVAIVYMAINVINVFPLVYLMTQGGPDRHTDVILTYLYEQSFKNYQFGYASSVAVANLALALGVALVLLFVFRKDPQGASA